RLYLSYELVQVLPSHLLVLEANVSGQLLWSGRPVSLQQSLHIRSPWVAVAGQVVVQPHLGRDAELSVKGFSWSFPVELPADFRCRSSLGCCGIGHVLAVKNHTDPYPGFLGRSAMPLQDSDEPVRPQSHEGRHL